MAPRPKKLKRLSSEMVEGFVAAFLLKNFDGSKPIPDFHRELWKLCCSDNPNVVIAAPRGHGKSTAITLAYALATLVFGIRSYMIIIASTYEEACEFLRAMADELKNNEAMEEVFGIPKFEKDSENDVIVRMGDLTFRVIAKGSGQKIRGRKWMNRRPDLIVIDDLEDDEAIMNADRREKLRKWFLSAVLPAGSDNCDFRMVGTVLHFDSLLERLLNDESWESVRFKAHADFSDFSEILWPDMWPIERLQKLRQRFINQGNAEGYSQEMLNTPIVAENAYFRRDDMLPMMPGDLEQSLIYYAAADLAISTKDRGNYTVITVAGVDCMGYTNIVDVRRGRWDSHGIIEEILSVHERYHPDQFAIERTHVEQTIGPFLKAEMRKRGVYPNMIPIYPVGDKPSRARAFQAMMRAGIVKFNKGATWWPDLEDEMCKFTNSGAKTGFDDQVDTLAYIGMLVEGTRRPETVDELDEIAYIQATRLNRTGRNRVTGY